ncbi:type VII secretion integral membrane protein EccD [Actinophytocola oryzae]|uniref:Type VII secretion integral membrane protein EccD n=1 Tax=Actinophytocola oryzae TaxID=502181 RepID=A0A4R7USM2_9PSEU|nr:type VII secretion integral membrane protein EccD [Actinophytocola oryzae]TDV34594.1 type VII secretion integral membrane protein EccD [Actinophytocola oryzae]
MEQQTQDRTNIVTRLRFTLDDSTTELAVPGGVPLGDVLPVVLGRFGTDAVERGVDHEGWVVRRPGGPVLDEERTPAELELTEDTVLELHARAEKLAPIDYDDVVDGVGEQVRGDRGGWSPMATKSMLLAGFVASMLTGLVLLVSGGGVVLPAAVAGGVGLVVMVGAALAARAAADAVMGTVLAGVATAHVAVACWLLVAVSEPSPPWQSRLVAAGIGALAALGAGLFAVADGAALFVGAGVAVLLVTIAAAVDAATTFGTSRTAMAGLAVALLAGFAIPAVASLLAVVPIPLLPVGVHPVSTSDGEDVDETAEDSAQETGNNLVVDRAHAAAVHACALHVGIGLASAAFLLALWPPDMVSIVCYAVFAAVVLLRARYLGGAVPRWVASGLFGFAALSAVLGATFALTH